MLKVEKIVSTPEDWATGYAIRVDTGEDKWEMIIKGHHRHPQKLLNDEDRLKMQTLRDKIIQVLTEHLK